MSTSIGHLAITVSDMQKSMDFYSKGMGFTKVFSIPDPQTGKPWIEYLHTGGDQFVELFYGGENDYRWDIRDRAYNHVCFVVSDIKEAVARLEKNLYKLDKQPKLGCDGNWQCWITDPDGVRIEIMQLGPDSPQSKVLRGEKL